MVFSFINELIDIIDCMTMTVSIVRNMLMTNGIIDHIDMIIVIFGVIIDDIVVNIIEYIKMVIVKSTTSIHHLIGIIVLTKFIQYVIISRVHFNSLN